MLAGVGEFFRSPKGPVIIYGEGGGGGGTGVNMCKFPEGPPLQA